MRGYLLDSSVALIATVRSVSLSDAVRTAVATGPNYLSALVYWEVMLKSMKGTLNVGDPRTWWTEALEQLSAIPIPLRPEHVARISELPPIHQDPFDRALLAQAQVEDLTLLTTDRILQQYASESLRILG